MTREAAIRILGRCNANFYWEDGEPIPAAEIAAAVELAIEALKQPPRMIGKWVKIPGVYFTPGGTPCYVCGGCGESEHLYGTEYPRRKVICDGCGRINIYPWEKGYEEGSTLWEDDNE